ncbi:MAG: hypothetical protein WBZ51_03280, partial [Xanthobacteraceae bacterium]
IGSEQCDPGTLIVMADENLRLRAALRDLVALSTIPAWSGLGRRRNSIAASRFKLGHERYCSDAVGSAANIEYTILR